MIRDREGTTRALALAAVIAAGALAGCWRMGEPSSGAPDGGDTVSDVGGPTDPYPDTDTGPELHWVAQVVDSPTGNDLAAVHGTGWDDVWAVGDDGVVLHYDGAEWTVVEGPPGGTLYGVLARSPWEVVAVGGDRRAHLWDGEAWTPLDTAWDAEQYPGAYLAICASSGNPPVIAGDDGTLAVWHETGFDMGYKTGVDMDFHALACLPGGGFYAAGHAHDAFASSRIVHCAEPWSCQEVALASGCDNMYAIAAAAETDVWAAGFNEGSATVFYRLAGGAFDMVDSTNPQILGMFLDATLGLWAVGGTTGPEKTGVIQQWSGGFEMTYQFGQAFAKTARLRAVWGTADAGVYRVYAVGKGGTIVHVEGGEL